MTDDRPYDMTNEDKQEPIQPIPMNAPTYGSFGVAHRVGRFVAKPLQWNKETDRWLIEIPKSCLDEIEYTRSDRPVDELLEVTIIRIPASGLD